MGTITRSLTYDPDEFPEIHEWIENLPDRRGALSEGLRRAILFYLENSRSANGQHNAAPNTEVEAQLSQLQKGIDELKAMLRDASENLPTQQQEEDLPPEVLKNLGSIGQ